VAWLSLGTKQPGFTWEIFDTAIFGDVAARITQTYNPSEVSFLNKIQLAEFYPFPEEDGFRYLRTIYPSTQPRLYNLTVPETFAAAGWTSRYLAVRHGYYGVADVANWTVEVEVYYQ
jgi:hypothetical protein